MLSSLFRWLCALWFVFVLLCNKNTWIHSYELIFSYLSDRLGPYGKISSVKSHIEKSCDVRNLGRENHTRISHDDRVRSHEKHPIFLTWPHTISHKMSCEILMWFSRPKFLTSHDFSMWDHVRFFRKGESYHLR